jgi:hypothetical protein
MTIFFGQPQNLGSNFAAKAIFVNGPIQIKTMSELFANILVKAIAA